MWDCMEPKIVPTSKSHKIAIFYYHQDLFKLISMYSNNVFSLITWLMQVAWNLRMFVHQILIKRLSFTNFKIYSN